jgi:hypothetical protein
MGAPIIAKEKRLNAKKGKPPFRKLSKLLARKKPNLSNSAATTLVIEISGIEETLDERF